MAAKKNNIIVPADVPSRARKTFIHNYNAITHSTDRLLLFACDQKIEHLDLDFEGLKYSSLMHANQNIYFRSHRAHPLAHWQHILGLLHATAAAYPSINYIVKLNGKTNLVPTDTAGAIKQSIMVSTGCYRTEKELVNLHICGVGYTIYLGQRI